MLATRVLFGYPGTSYSRWSPRFVLWPPGELPVSQSAGHPHAGCELLTARLRRNVGD